MDPRRTRLPVAAAALAVLALSLARCASAPTPLPDEAGLRAVDERQRQVVLARDVEGLKGLLHPALRVNAPSNRILTREQLLAMVGSGDIAAESFERVPEQVTVTGTLGVVMGHETFTPVATSELGRLYGARLLSRRYTNVYLHEAGGWRLLARHANVVCEPAAPAPAR
jgi:hypothetical protein